MSPWSLHKCHIALKCAKGTPFPCQEQNYCSRFSVSFPGLFLGTFVASVPVCLLLTHSPSNVKKVVTNLFVKLRVLSHVLSWKGFVRTLRVQEKVRWWSGECQVKIKYQSELDIGGRETCLIIYHFLKVVLLLQCPGQGLPEESLGKIFVMKQSEMMMMMNVWGLALGYQGDRLSNVVNVG